MVKTSIELLCSGWVPKTQPDLAHIKGLSHIPEHVAVVNMLSFIEQAATERQELIAKNKDVNLQPVCKGESDNNENDFDRKRRKQEETKNIFRFLF